MQGNVIKKNDPECCPVLIDDTQDLEKCEDATPDAIKKCEGGIPNVRFQGFTDDWEQRKCGDVLNERNIQHPQSEEFPLVSFTVENGVTSKTERYEREQLVRGSKEAKKYKETRLDDIVYNPANLKFGAIARNKLGNAVFSPIYVTYEVDKSLALPSFVEMFVTRNNFIQNALQYQQGTVYERMSVSTADFATLDITLPSIAEQKQIGQYFQQLDHLITLHQRKCDETRGLKKYMLQKMFPRDGEKVPEIRFQGFMGEWAQRKLGGLCDITTGKLDANAMVQNGQFDFYTSGIDVYKIDKAAFEGPAITIAGNGASVGYMHLVDGKFNAYQRTYVLTGFLADRQFLNVAIGNELPAKIQEEVRGSGIPYIVLNMLTELNIPFPSHNEQKQIGEFFRNLDHLITLHQRKSDELKELKRYMLQNMFP